VLLFFTQGIISLKIIIFLSVEHIELTSENTCEVVTVDSVLFESLELTEIIATVPRYLNNADLNPFVLSP